MADRVLRLGPFRLCKRGCYGHLVDRCFSGGRVDLVRRLIAFCVLGLFACASLYAAQVGETGEFRLWYSASVTFGPPNGGGGVATATLGPGVHHCVSSEFGGDPAPGQGKVCTFPVQTCPDGSTTNTSGAIECPSNPCADKAGKPWGESTPNGAWVTSRDGALNFCPDGACTVVGSGSGKAADGYTYIWGPWSYTGSQCGNSQNPGSGESSAPSPCAKGTCPGTVNGTQVCVACTSTTSTKSSESSSSSSSAASGAEPSASQSSSGKSESTTTCSGSSCTTTKTSTVKNPDGSTTTTNSSETKDKGSYCSENPKDLACKGDDDSSWGGSCSSGFQCDGDAVQCAQAQASWKAACAMQVDDSDSGVRLGKAAIGAGVGGFAAGTDPGAGSGNTVNISTDFDRTNPYSAACPADRSFTLMGKTMALPFSSLCPYLQLMGYILIAVTLIAASKIALGGS